jgi:hypothetical protein
MTFNVPGGILYQIQSLPPLQRSHQGIPEGVDFHPKHCMSFHYLGYSSKNATHRV